MTIKTYVARLDDYTGELGLNLARLENADAQGKASPDQELEFINELKRKAYGADLRPWLRRGIFSAVGAGALFALWETVEVLFPDLVESMGNTLEFAPLLGVLALVFAVCSFLVYSWRKKIEMAWFRDLEATVRRGGSIVDL